MPTFIRLTIKKVSVHREKQRKGPQGLTKYCWAKFSLVITPAFKKRSCRLEKADRTAYDVRYNCRTESPKMLRMEQLWSRDHAAHAWLFQMRKSRRFGFSLCVVSERCIPEQLLLYTIHPIQQNCNGGLYYITINVHLLFLVKFFFYFLKHILHLLPVQLFMVNKILCEEVIIWER